MPDALKGLQEIRRVLRAGAWALFLEHVRPGHRGWRRSSTGSIVVSRRGPHINRRTMETIRAAGFVVREENLMSDVLKLVVAHP